MLKIILTFTKKDIEKNGDLCKLLMTSTSDDVVVKPLKWSKKRQKFFVTIEIENIEPSVSMSIPIEHVSTIIRKLKA